MNTKEAISLLQKIDQEQRTLMSLLPQFSVAMQSLSAVASQFEKYNDELPKLQQEHATLTREVNLLDVQLKDGKRNVEEEVNAHRASLQGQLGSINSAITAARTEHSRVQKTLLESEEFAKSRREALDKEIELLMGKRAAALHDIEVLKARL